MGRYSQNVYGKRFSEAYKQKYLAYTYSKSASLQKDQFWTALGAVRFDLFRSLNGFSETFAGAGPEDIDLGIRLTKNGYKVYAVPEATAQHLAHLNYKELILNDLRKGSEDVYIHWKNRVRLTNNRHAGSTSIAAVLVCGLIGLFLLMRELKWLIVSVTTWFILRIKLINFLTDRFRSNVVQITVTTLILDFTRGIAVFLGSSLYHLEILTNGSVKPFQKK